MKRSRTNKDYVWDAFDSYLDRTGIQLEILMDIKDELKRQTRMKLVSDIVFIILALAWLIVIAQGMLQVE